MILYSLLKLSVGSKVLYSDGLNGYRISTLKLKLDIKHSHLMLNIIMQCQCIVSEHHADVRHISLIFLIYLGPRTTVCKNGLRKLRTIVKQGPKPRRMSLLTFLLNHILHSICIKILFTESKYFVSNWLYSFD